MVHCRVQKSPPLVPVVSQNNIVSITPSYLPKIHFNIILIPTSRSSQWFLSFLISHQNPICIPLRPMRATCPAYLTLLDLIIEYKSWSPSFCTFLQSPIISLLFSPNILLRTLFAVTLGQSRRPDPKSRRPDNGVRMISLTRDVRFRYCLSHWRNWLNWGMTWQTDRQTDRYGSIIICNELNSSLNSLIDLFHAGLPLKGNCYRNFPP
jgi:hypothetical protein